MDTRRMHAVFGGQILHRALALHGLLRHAAGLESRIMAPEFLHVLILVPWRSSGVRS
jgi:hypothetical protein